MASTTSPSPFTARMRSGAQRAGLPARSSRCCRLSAMPEGDSRSATLRSHPGNAANGSAACWPAAGDCCAYRCSIVGSAWETPCWPDRAGRMTIVSAAIAIPSAPSPPASSTEPGTSHLHVDDLAHPERAEYDARHRAAEHEHPGRGRVERAHVGRAAVEEPRAHARRQADDDVPGQPSLGAERPYLAADVGALAHGADGGAQHLGQVAADVALNTNRHHRPAQVNGVHPLGDAAERVLQVGADPGLRERTGELARRWLGVL